MNIGRVEVKKRGVETESMQKFSRLKLKGDQTAVVILTRQADKRLAIIAKRVRYASPDSESTDQSEKT